MKTRTALKLGYNRADRNNNGEVSKKNERPWPQADGVSDKDFYLKAVVRYGV